MLKACHIIVSCLVVCVNVVFLSELYYPHGGGAELATYLYAKLLNERGFNVTVVTNKFDGESEICRRGNMLVYRLPLFKKVANVKYSMLQRADVLFSGFMRKMMRLADVVYVPRFWFSSILLAKAYRKPVVTHVHDYIPICPLANLFNASRNVVCDNATCSLKCVYSIERASGRSLIGTLESVLLNPNLRLYFSRVIGLSDAVICVSEAQRGLIKRKHAGWASKLHVIYNPLPEVSEIKANGEDFGYFGGRSYMKGFHVLFRAVVYFAKRKYRPLTIHATKFKGFNGRFYDVLSRFGIVPYGKLSIKDYDELYSRVGTVVVPSVWAEPLPYVVTEAMLNGKLVIASGVGGIPEQVAGCDGAFLFDAMDYKQLAEKMLYVRGLSKESLVDLGIKNRQCVMRKFSNEKTAADFINLLVNVADKEQA